MKFEKGQSVWDAVAAPGMRGIVSGLEGKGELCVVVYFGTAVYKYTEDGRLSYRWSPTLSTYPYKIKMEGEKWEPMTGELVLARNDEDGHWFVDRFQYVTDKGYYFCNAGMWQKVEPFDHEKALRP